MLNEEPALPSWGLLRARGAAAISRLTPEAAPVRRGIATFTSQSLGDSDLG